MAVYRYRFYDLATNSLLGELPLIGVTFASKFNDVGDFSASLLMADSRIAAMQPLTVTQPGRTAVYVDRDGTLVWGGVVVLRGYQASTFMLAIRASEFMWYFSQKRVIATTKAYTNQDQLFIAQDLVNYAQGVASGSIGVVVPSNTSGVLRTVTYNSTDRKKVGQAIADLAQLDNGFDWAIDVAYVAGLPTKTLTLSYPRRGVTFQNSGWTFEYPGNIHDYTWPEDSSSQAITAYVQGAGTGTNMVSATNTNTALLDGGYPLIEDLFQAKDQTDPGMLAARAVAAVKAYANPVVLPQLYVRANQDPLLGSYKAGDDVRVRITDPRWPAQAGAPGLETFYRITTIQVTPQDNAPETVTLTLGAVP